MRELREAAAEMKIEGIRYADGELHIKCNPQDGVQATYKIEPGKEYDIVLHKNKRSLDANAYAWVLIDKLSAKLGLSPIEVYRQAIENTGGVTATIVCVADVAAPTLIKSWEKGHLGRQCQQFPSNTPGYVNVKLIYGSSDYSTQQMSRFIDGLVQDAQALGIETMPPEKLESLLSSWK